MRKNKLAITGLTFSLGAVFGISILMLVSFIKPAVSPSSPAPLPVITLAEANRLFHNYYDHATINTEKLKGFYVDRLQLEIMDSLARNRAIVGFRIYMGKNDRMENVSILVGATSPTTLDITGAVPKIYKTDSRITEPCPPNCDSPASITR